MRLDLLSPMGQSRPNKSLNPIFREISFSNKPVRDLLNNVIFLFAMALGNLI